MLTVCYAINESSLVKEGRKHTRQSAHWSPNFETELRQFMEPCIIISSQFQSLRAVELT